MNRHHLNSGEATAANANANAADSGIVIDNWEINLSTLAHTYAITDDALGIEILEHESDGPLYAGKSGGQPPVAPKPTTGPNGETILYGSKGEDTMLLESGSEHYHFSFDAASATYRMHDDTLGLTRILESIEYVQFGDGETMSIDQAVAQDLAEMAFQAASAMETALSGQSYLDLNHAVEQPHPLLELTGVMTLDMTW